MRVFIQALQLAGLSGDVAGDGEHLLHEVVGIHDGALAGLHLAFRQFDHAIAEVVAAFRLLETQLGEDQEQHLEVVFLFVAHRIDLTVQVVEVLEAQKGRPDVLGHVDGRAILAQEQFLIEPIACQVHPDRSVLALVEHATCHPFQHPVLADEVGVAFVVELVELDAHGGIGDIETTIDPSVHGLPQVDRVSVALFPQTQCILRLEQDGRLFFGVLLRHAAVHELLDLCFEGLVEGHVILAHQFVSLQSARFRGFASAKFAPGDHGFADVDAAVIDDLHLGHAVSSR